MNEKEKREWLDQRSKEMKDEFLKEVNIKSPTSVRKRAKHQSSSLNFEESHQESGTLIKHLKASM